MAWLHARFPKFLYVFAIRGLRAAPRRYGFSFVADWAIRLLKPYAATSVSPITVFYVFTLYLFPLQRYIFNIFNTKILIVKARVYK